MTAGVRSYSFQRTEKIPGQAIILCAMRAFALGKYRQVIRINQQEPAELFASDNTSLGTVAYDADSGT